MTSTRRNHVQDGFTLIELVVAIAILALLAGAAVTAYNMITENARVSATKETIRSLKIGIEAYNGAVGTYPQTLDDLMRRPSDPNIASKWRGPYVEDFSGQDPWGEAFVYRKTPGKRHPYELYSLGGKGDEGTDQDRIGVFNQ